ncbi:MAG: hypothetical protein JSR19_11060 [Proteobacteria bacterium]|nr:hypothetical protein [Pseudomonadota bacterium]HQR02582.1 hypothetical protein [Rhodocyclaceae bacterium]
MQRIDWVRFIPVSTAVALLVFVLDVVFHGTLAKGMYVGYPSRTPEETMSLFPFLVLTYLGQLMTFCYLYLKVSPARSKAHAVWWGLWGGLFVMYPNMQFFVAVRDTSWTLLWAQVTEGIALTVVTALVFEIFYRPRASHFG